MILNFPHSTHWKSFAVRFVFPTAVTIALFVTSLFSIIIPAFENSSLERKREMIRELTNSAWNILAKLEHDEQRGVLSREQAQAQAIEQIKNLHYGQEMKDYFWINDMHPRMVFHPYRTDLNGKDLTDYKDPTGKRVFVEFVDIVKQQGAGYVNYQWQWKDDPSRILPKISYVKGFVPWGWIIGTGIYIDDVKKEIAAMKRNIIEISLFILCLIAVLLASIIRQSYTTLKLQQFAEQALRESEEKYRTLVESAGEGMLMALESVYMYANQTIADLLGYDKTLLSSMRVYELFPDLSHHPSGVLVQELISGKSVPKAFETCLKTASGEIKDVIFSTTPIEIGGKNGFIAVVTDITKRKAVEAALEESEAKFRTLAHNLNVGIFRRTVDDKPKFIEANPAMVKLLGYETREELLAVSPLDLYVDPEDRKHLEPKAFTEDLKREVVRLKKKDGSTFTACIWGVMVEDEQGNPAYFDGVMEDITDLHRKEEKREKLLSELQTALLFFNQSLGSLPLKEIVTCRIDTPVEDAVKLMEDRNTEIMLVCDPQGTPCGVVTDHDLRKLVSQSDDFKHTSLCAIMSPHIFSLPSNSCLFESWLLMRQHEIGHLFITDSSGAFVGVIANNDIVALQKYSPAVLLSEVRMAMSVDEVIDRTSNVPHLITLLVHSGAKPSNINHMTTVIADTILQRFIEFAMKELGLPPVRFAFVVFGSEGRQEQTLRTDQDNAIIFEDVDENMTSVVQKYFLTMGSKVCGWLHRAGYTYCEGNNMAQNPLWCQPLTVWKRYFSEWVHAASSEDLLNTKIFFDLRCAYGEQDFVIELRNFLDDVVGNNPRFFHLLARNVLPLSPPIGLFGKFVVESVGERGKAFDIKSAMMPIVDFARIYALQHAVHATNTIERLNALQERNVLSRENHQEMVQAFSYLMHIRLRIQAEAISRGEQKPDNYVNPKHLTYIEQRLLKEIFSQIKNFQARLSYDFTGQLGGL